MSRRVGRILLRCDAADYYTKIRKQRREREGILEVYLTYRNDFRTSSPFKPANDYLLTSSSFLRIFHTQSFLCERERKRGERWQRNKTERKIEREREKKREGNVGVPRLGFIRRAPAAAAAALRREITRGPLKRAVRARYDSNVPSFMCACGSNTVHTRARMCF